MLVHVTWPDGGETRIEMQSLGDLDAFLGTHLRRGMEADLTTAGDDLRLTLRAGGGDVDPRDAA